MTTARDTPPPDQTTASAGGKLRKTPLRRRNIPATPYARPPTAIRNKNPNLLTKIIDPASRLLYAGANKLFGVVFGNRNLSLRPSDSLLAQTSDITTFMDWFCKRRGITELKLQDLEGPAVDDPILRHNVSKPLPLRGPPGQVTIQSDFFFNKDLEYLRYGSKGRRPALFISKMKAAYYPDAGLEQMVPDQFWIEEDIVRTHKRILNIVRIEVFSMYGYDYMKKIVLYRADLNEHVIAERDFKYLYPSDFEDLNLLNLQGHLNHLPPKDKKILTIAVNQWTRQLVIRQRVEDFQLGIESYQTQVNLTKPQWTATGFEYKHDYTVIESPRAVIFRDKYEVQMMMRFNEIHKFSDGTLHQIIEALDYRSAPASDHSKSKCTIESRAKRSSKIISLGHDSTLLASSYTVKSKAYFKSPTHYPCGIVRTSE
nr:nuclear pore complex protein NUP1-like isoform X1 [Tanacetum cinerariifolium]